MNLPADVSQITFSQFLDIKAVENKHRGNWEQIVIETVKLFTEVDEKTEFGKHDSRIELGKEFTVVGAYYWIVGMIADYISNLPEGEPQYSFKHKGVKYVVTEDRVHGMTGRKHTVGEVIEALHFQQLFEKAASKVEEGEIFDGDCAFEFQLGLREIALICRQPGEKLPIDPGPRKAFLDERMLIFEDLPMHLVLNVRFFLLDTLKRLETTRITGLFSKVQD